MHAVISLLSLAAVASAGSLKFTKCNGGERGDIIQVSCEQFTDYAEVILKHGQMYNFTIKFKAGDSSDYLANEIYGVIDGHHVEMRSIPGNSCGSPTGNKCPIVSGQEYSYSVSLPISYSYPAISLMLRWVIVSANEYASKGNKQICFFMPAKITA